MAPDPIVVAAGIGVFVSPLAGSAVLRGLEAAPQRWRRTITWLLVGGIVSVAIVGALLWRAMAGGMRFEHNGRSAHPGAEIAAELARQAGAAAITAEHVREATQHKALKYDRAGEEHYNVISAFIKSMRGSDCDAALYWMMRMVEAGEDPMFIARRMVIFAAEDVGNADPRALTIATSVKDAVEFVGMPEGVIPLAQGVTYLASAPKSNASYRAMLAAREDVRKLGALPVPMHIRNAPTPLMRDLGYGSGYRYPHDYEGAVTEQDYLPEELLSRQYYAPSERGYEIRIREYLQRARRSRSTSSGGKDQSFEGGDK